MDHVTAGHVYAPSGAGTSDAGNPLVSSITTVGIDVGTTTSHMSVTNLRLRSVGIRFQPFAAETLYESPVILTPYQKDGLIDVEEIRTFLAKQYSYAHLERDEVDTGVVLLTGLAAEAGNSRRVADLFADESGRFVAIGAGHHLEAELSARGAGAALASAATESGLLHIDIGGGTTKFAYCRKGRVRSTAALCVGARPFVRDADGVIVEFGMLGARALGHAGASLSIGDVPGDDEVSSICGFLADRILDVVFGRVTEPATRELLLTNALDLDGFDAVTFSGGVAEFVYGRTSDDYGDLGEMLGCAVRERLLEHGVPISNLATGGIRATVTGASRFGTQVSSQSVLVNPPDVLPLRNVPAIVVAPFAEGGALMAEEEISEAVRLAIARRRIDIDRAQVALALKWRGLVGLKELDVVCRGLIEGVKPALDSGSPLIIICDLDIGKLIGLHICDEGLFDGATVCIDGISVAEFDYVDLGSIGNSTGFVPVVVKSLIFGAEESI